MDIKTEHIESTPTTVDLRIALLEKHRETPFTPEQRAKLPGKLLELDETIATLRSFRVVDGGCEPAVVFHAAPPNSLPLNGSTPGPADAEMAVEPHD